MKTTSYINRNQVSTLTILLSLIALAAAAIPSAAADSHGIRPAITLAELEGSWAATIVGEGSCGIGSELLTFTLNSSGEATDAAWTYHTVSCGNDEIKNQTFKITFLNSDGSGTAQLDVNGALQNFTIQVSPDHQIFNMVDLTDSGHYKTGTAVKQ